MPSFIVITSRKSTDFDEEAKTVLESHKFAEVSQGTYMAASGASQAASKLKNLDSFKENKSNASIKIYYGSLNT